MISEEERERVSKQLREAQKIRLAKQAANVPYVNDVRPTKSPERSYRQPNATAMKKEKLGFAAGYEGVSGTMKDNDFSQWR